MGQGTVMVDGSLGEGGGQILRTAVALSVVTGKAVEVKNIRAGRRNPGLAPQHVAAVNAIARISGATVDGVLPRSERIIFRPDGVSGGEYHFDVGTAGSITLVLQACVPPLLFSRCPSKLTVTGGTDVTHSPPADYMLNVLFPALRTMGADINGVVSSRGYYPKGGGEVTVNVGTGTSLRIPDFVKGSKTRSASKIHGIAHSTGLPRHVCSRMAKSADARIHELLGDISIGIEERPSEKGPALGAGITLWSGNDAVFKGSSALGERGLPAEKVGSDVATAITEEILSVASVDTHLADQLLVYIGMCGGGNISARNISSHTQTCARLIEQFMPVKFTMAQKGDLWEISAQMVPLP